MPSSQRSGEPTHEVHKTFMGHLMELRWRLIVSIASVVICTGACLFYHRPLMKLLQGPLNGYNDRVRKEHRTKTAPVDRRLMEIRVRLVSLDPASADRTKLEADRNRLQSERDALGDAPVVKLHSLGPASGFLAVMKIGLWAGLLVSLPILISQFWSFVRPGLLKTERRAVTPIFIFGVFFFLAGAYLAYEWVVPTTLDFLYTFNRGIQIGELNLIGPYIGFVINLMLAFGIAFEMPLVILALSHVGLVTPGFLWRNARYAVLVAFITGALLTPPDIISQILLGSCLLVLYVVSILFSYLVVRKKAQEESALAEDSDD